MNKPTMTHLTAAIRILRYLRGSTNWCLKYTNNNEVNNQDKSKNEITVTAYSDADWGGDIDDKKSTSGYCIFVDGNLAHWGSKKQQTVATSSAEAEYMALYCAVSYTESCKQILTELGFQSKITNVDIL